LPRTQEAWSIPPQEWFLGFSRDPPEHRADAEGVVIQRYTLAARILGGQFQELLDIPAADSIEAFD
jgi:hypothetical protein